MPEERWVRAGCTRGCGGRSGGQEPAEDTPERAHERHAHADMDEAIDAYADPARGDPLVGSYREGRRAKRTR